MHHDDGVIDHRRDRPAEVIVVALWIRGEMDGGEFEQSGLLGSCQSFHLFIRSRQQSPREFTRPGLGLQLLPQFLGFGPRPEFQD
ncbi:MAG: hypothetical protein ACI9OD_004478 [Limisphaerales bacterium]|jgi:hypothetical protein